jgi:hypothetical protein
MTKLVIEVRTSNYFHHQKVSRKRVFLKSGDKDISSSSYSILFSLKKMFFFSARRSFLNNKEKLLSKRYIL